MPFVLLRISYLWYTVIGMMIVLIFGTLISILTNAIGNIIGATELSTVKPNGAFRRKSVSSTEEVS